MQYIEGGDLKSIINNNIKLSLKEINNLMVQTLEGLLFIHTKRATHRDIKPANILREEILPGAYRYIYTDFGSAKVKDRGHTRSLLKTNYPGTPLY